MSIQKDFKDFFVEHFVPIDNIPEDTVTRHQICMEARASLLIEGNRSNGKFPAFMKYGIKKDTDWIYNFSEDDKFTYPCTINKTFPGYLPVQEELQMIFNSFVIHNSQSGTGYIWEPYINECLLQGRDLHIKSHLYKMDGSKAVIDDESYIYHPSLQEIYKKAVDSFQRQYRSKFRFTCQVSPYKTPEQVCRFWQNESSPFAKVKCSNVFNEVFMTQSEPPPTEDGQTEIFSVHERLQWTVPCSCIGQNFPVLLHKYYGNWCCMAFPFKNRYGETVMWLIKIYNAETQQKCLLPVTSWCYHFSSASQYYCIPLPADKQPLYNLDLLFKPETETIVLTDSVEIADSCQRNAPKNTVFTSFLCEPGHYEQVDWLPLDGKKIHYLITNHSGISLDGATLKAKELSDFLTSDESGLNHGIELDFFILRFQYNSESPIRFRTVDDILEQYSRHTEINSKEFRYLEGDNEFKALCTDAENHIKNVNLRWWQESGHATEEIRLVEEKQNKKAPINYLLHPLLVKGESTMLYAKPKLGKSALAYSIAAVIVARGFSERPTSLLQEKCWYVANGKHKVLYLEFENTSQIDTRQKDFQYAYFSKEKQKECLANLIVKDMSSRSLDYSAPQNHQVILDMIEAAKKEGTSDLAVELVVIDTYTAFVRSENPQTTANFKEMLNKIRNMGIAVLIVHHANSSNIARGLSDKLDQLAFKFRLSRENNELDNLEAPITVTYEETRCDMNAKMKLPFEIFYSKEDHRWHLKADESEAENLKRFKELYENSGYSEYDICQMSGLKKSTYHERLKGKK